jgi:signal transduction histidine kinase
MEVSDNGSGISEDVLPRIFDPYFTTRASHRGLGLALVQGIARSHGGAVSVSSDPGRDTRFTVVFPIETAPGGLIKNDRTAGSDDLPGGHP